MAEKNDLWQTTKRAIVPLSWQQGLTISMATTLNGCLIKISSWKTTYCDHNYFI